MGFRNLPKFRSLGSEEDPKNMQKRSEDSSKICSKIPSNFSIDKIAILQSGAERSIQKMERNEIENHKGKIVKGKR